MPGLLDHPAPRQSRQRPPGPGSRRWSAAGSGATATAASMASCRLCTGASAKNASSTSFTTTMSANGQTSAAEAVAGAGLNRLRALAARPRSRKAATVGIGSLRLADQNIAPANGRFGNRGGVKRRIGARNHDDRVFTPASSTRIIAVPVGASTDLSKQATPFSSRCARNSCPKASLPTQPNKVVGAPQFGRCHCLVGALAPPDARQTLAWQGFTGLRQPGHGGH